MTKVNWLIERNIFDFEEQFLEELIRQGYTYKETKYLQFHPKEAYKYFTENDCILFRGTLNLGRDILKTSWIPGAYMDEKIFVVLLTTLTLVNIYSTTSISCSP